MRHIHIFSSLAGSLGEITNDIVSSLSTKFFITEDFKGDMPRHRDIFVCHFLNKEVTKTEEFNTFKKRILIQPIDGTSIWKESIDAMNKFDLIITPGSPGKEILIKNGVKTKIIVIPNYYKDEIFEVPPNPIIQELRNKTKDKVVFYFESQTLPRKGTELLYRNFVEAFSDTPLAKKVILLVKDNKVNERTYNINEELKREIFKLQRSYSYPTEIIKITQDLHISTMIKLWALADVYISMAKFEGFGLPIVRMAALQKPIIALDSPYCGYMDFLNKKNAYLIPSVSVLAKYETFPLYTPKTRWSVPVNTKSTMKVLHKCLEDVLNERTLLVKQQEIQKYHIDNVMSQYEQIFNTI